MVIKFKALTADAVNKFLETVENPEDFGSFIVAHTAVDCQYVYYSFMHNTQEANAEFIQGIVDLGFVVVGVV